MEQQHDDNDWQSWKDTEAEHPGINFETWKANRAKAMVIEYNRLRQETGKGSKPTQVFSEATQRHHDYYVKLEHDGNLPKEDVANLDLARQREKAGLVHPLPQDVTGS